MAVIRRLAPRGRGLLALAALLVGVPVFAQSAAITASSPATLNQGNLRQATVSVTLTSATYESSADASHFTLTTAVPGLTVHGVAFNSGRTVATLRLHYDGSDFDAAATIAVTVAAAGTNHNSALTTSTQAVSPARWVNVSKKTVALTEGGSAGTYTVVLESAPTGNVTLTVTSDNAAVTVDTDATPLTRELTFTTMNWATAQTVTVTPVDDNADAVDELALVTNVATGGGYSSSTTADRTVRVTVADDERTGTDYDADDDQLIEIDSLAKLNAMRWDVDGNGAVAAGNAADYAAAFPGAATGMGCPDGGDGDQLSDGCRGYELTANLDFDTNGDGNVNASDAYPNWTPISALGRTFHGNNHTISNLTTSGSGRERGLFARLGGSARVSNLGLVDFAVSRSTAASTGYAGALAGDSLGTIAAVHVRGGMISVSASGATSDAHAGGLVGRQTGGSITACYSTAAVSARGNVSFGGGLAGLANNAAISVSYAAGAVSGRADLTVRFGGLLGAADGTTVVTNSYAAESVTGTVSAGGSLLLRGLVARRLGGSSTAAASYWDSQATGQSSSALGTAQTTYGLQTPTAYGAGATDIYAYWDDYDTDGDGRIDADDDAWHFGQANQYPSLKWGGLDPAEQFAAAPVDYDDDNDNLIDIRSLAQLDAVRHDLNGDGAPTAAGHGVYVAAFPNAATGMGCAATCTGYELRNDLDFDTDGDGDVDADDPNSYPSWTPIGGTYSATFEGNGHVVSRLTVSASGSAGLFHTVSGAVRGLGLKDANVRSGGGFSDRLGALAGIVTGQVTDCWASGSVAASSGYLDVGGLVGFLNGANARLTTSYSTASVTGSQAVGGLVGRTFGGARIVASYSTGTVTGHRAGGLVGIHSNNTSIDTSYFAGRLVKYSSSSTIDGLAGQRLGAITNSYFDSGTTGLSGAGAQTTAALQNPSAYAGIYASWNVDLNGDSVPDNPWRFASGGYPTLRARHERRASHGEADGLIDVTTLAQLNAMRHDLDGDGVPASAGVAAYGAAFPGLVCPSGTCRGYELRNDLDFDTDGDGDVDADDDYPNWTPIPAYGGTAGPAFQTTFRGNRHVIDNLRVRRPLSGGSGFAPSGAGLFGVVGASGRIESLGVVNASVVAPAGTFAGVVAGRLEGGRIVACYSTGSVSALGMAGGLVGRTISQVAKDEARIVASYSTAEVSTIAKTGPTNRTAGNAGGLVGGHNNGVIVASYATGPVVARSGPAYTGPQAGHGLSAGVDTSAFWVGAVRDSYWDTQTTGQTTTYATSQTGVDGGDVGTGVVTTTGGQTTAALQSPTGYTGIYASWNIDLDGDDAPDDPWDFGTSNEYPTLKWGAPAADAPQDASGAPTEVRAETTGQGLVVSWRAVPGATAYRVQWRQPGEAWSSARQAETTETRYEIVGLADGAYEVRVLAVIDGVVGEPSTPAQGQVEPPGNRPPRALGLADMELDLGETAQVDLDAAFEDPNEDALRYSVAVDGDAVEAWVSSATLRLRGRRTGEATVTVTATDPRNLSASASFTAQVGVVLSLHGTPAVPEGGVIALRAELSRPLAADVVVGWRLAADDDPGTADADAADFGAWAGTATFAAGETRTRIVVAVLDDDDIEPARERFAVELEEPEDGNIGLSARAWRVLGSVQEGVCDRTPAVRAELSRGWRGCHWPRPSDLAGRATLDLRGTSAESLHADDLLGLSGLRTLDLGGNALRELPAGLLSHSPRLRALRLDGNRLQSLPPGLFAGVSSLRELRLSGNPGAPFALAPELRRTDAEPWAAGPATVEAALPLGAPFAMRLALTAAGGEASAEELTLAAGAVASGAAQVSGDGPVRVALVAPTIPDARCGDAPCFTGLAAQGATLALFAAPPSVASELAPADLLGAGDARIDLSAHFAVGGGALTYSATVDAPNLASVSVDGATLLVSANEDGEEGTATVTVVATDEFGQTATLRFAVEVSPPPPGNWRGWRTTLTPSAPSP